MLGPAGLDASRHRGLSKSVKPVFALSRYDGQAASPPNPRRPARGVYRFAPRRSSVVDPFVTLQPRRGAVTLHRFGPGNSAGILLTRLPAYRPSEGLGARLTRQDTCGLDRRAMTAHLRCHRIPRPPLPAPRLETLIRHPSVTRAGCRDIILRNIILSRPSFWLWSLRRGVPSWKLIFSPRSHASRAWTHKPAADVALGGKPDMAEPGE